MPTASIYYQPSRSTDLHFVLVNGDSLDCEPLEGETHLDTVIRTLARMGWEPADSNAATVRIIRQADGRGTIAIKPLRPAVAHPLDVDTIWVNTDVDDIPYRVAVGGKSENLPAHPKHSLTHPDATRRAEALDRVDAAVRRMGYTRDNDYTVSVAVDADGRKIHTATARPVPADWRDAPTLVRITDDAARALTAMADKLGILADELADAWILRAAQSAKDTHARWSRGGYIEDHSRIIGWDPTGCPYLKG